jgi:hypothetical protein
VASPLRIWHPSTNAALDHPLRPPSNVAYVLPPFFITMDELHRVYDFILEGIQTLF